MISQTYKNNKGDEESVISIVGTRTLFPKFLFYKVTKLPFLYYILASHSEAKTSGQSHGLLQKRQNITTFNSFSFDQNTLMVYRR